jgi:curved DNA-binding protein CbpA
MAMKGLLSEGVLPKVLQDLYVGRKTGVLRCSLAGEQRNLRFRRGHIVRADTNVQGKQLGEVLVEQAWLSPENLERATATVKETGRRLGEVLIEMGVLTSDKLEDALALHVRDIVARVFTWREGEYQFEEEPDLPGAEATLRLSTGELILEAVRQVGDPDVIRYALGEIDRVLALSSDPLLRFQKVALSPTDGFVLSRVDGTLSAREILQMIPLPEEEVQKSLFGLLCTGIIEYPPEGARKAPPANVGPARPVGTPVSRAPASAPPPSPPAAAAQRPPAPAVPPPTAPQPSPATISAAAPPATSPAIESRRQEIRDAHEGLKSLNYFEVLGIARSANEQQVKEAYFRLARRFHPDSHHDATLSDLVDMLEAVFIRLGEAYETLKNPRARADYEERLGRQRPRAEVVAGGADQKTSAASAAPAAAAADPAAERAAAENDLRKAGWFFEKEKFYDAIQLLEPALERLEGKAQIRARVLLAKAYMKNPKWLKRGEETLQGVVQSDPQNIEAYLLLGGLFRDRGLKSRASAMFRKVLELKPDHEEALAEVGPLPTAEAPPPAGSGGLLGKLFRRG